MSSSSIRNLDIGLDHENGTDYMVINQGFIAEGEFDYSESSPGGDALSTRSSSPRSMSFKCSQCFKYIDLGKPIYMRNDFPYCSKDCREKGVSSIYRVIFGSLMDSDIGFVSRFARHIGGSVASFTSSVDSAEDEESFESQSRIGSYETTGGNHVQQASSSCPQRGAAHNDARARARSFLNSVIGSVSRTSVGSSFIRSYSSSVLWGKDMTRNTSLNVLFSYLPELTSDQQNEKSITHVSSSSDSSTEQLASDKDGSSNDPAAPSTVVTSSL